MSAAVIQFRKSNHKSQQCFIRDQAGMTVEFPAALAGRISQAALWANKSSDAFVIDMCLAAFPPENGAA